jgi:hypothetical protein
MAGADDGITVSTKRTKNYSETSTTTQQQTSALDISKEALESRRGMK